MDAGGDRGIVRAAAGLGILLMFGLIVGGYLLGAQVRGFKRADRYVEVKGLVERTVKSDSAIWIIDYKEPGQALADAFAASERDKTTVLTFLASQGFQPSEITVGPVDVTDKSTEQYGNDKGPRFIVDQAITVETGSVDKVAAANARTSELIKAGVVISSGGNQGSGVTYKFNGLNAIKPDMITEATRNARSSAERFAADSGSKVGAIRDANQGTFSISAANAGPTLNDDAGQYGADRQADSSIMKKIRVVSTIDYYLQD